MTLPKYPGYKDSGVDWAGSVPAHWSVESLKRGFSVVGGSTPKSDEATYWDGDVVWVSPADLSRLPSLYISDSAKKITQDGLKSCGTTLVPPGSVVLSTRAPIGSLAIATTLLCTNQGCKSLVPGNDVHVLYFAYVLLSATVPLNLRGKGTTFLELSADELKAFKVPMPPHNEQVTIAAFLDRETAKIDALIAEQEKLIALLAEKRQATLSHAVTRGLNPNAPMKDSGVAWLGEVPAHWDVKRVKHLVRESIAGPYGSSLTKSMYVASGYRVYGQQQVIPDDFSVGDYYISEEKFAAMSRYQVAPDDILISVMGTIGRAAVVPHKVEPGIINPRLVLYRVFERLVLPRYLQTFLNNPTSERYFSLAAQGTTMEGLNMGSIGELYVALPPPNEQLEILKFVQLEGEKLDALSVESERAIALLKERRSALIAAAVTGQIDVRGALPQSA